MNDKSGYFASRFAFLLILAAATDANAQFFPGTDLLIHDSLVSYTQNIPDGFSRLGVHVSGESLMFAATLPTAHTDALFEIYGDATLRWDSLEVQVSLGTAELPGATAEGDLLKSFGGTITGPFKIDGVTIHPVNLSFSFLSDSLIVYGSTRVEFADTEGEATLGNEQSPGLVVKGGKHNRFNLQIEAGASLTLGGFSVTANSLGITWNESELVLAGAGQITLGSDHLDFSLGSEEHPGVVITDSGALEDFDLALTGTFGVAGLDLEIDNLTLVKNGGDFSAHGTAKLASGGDYLELALGSATEPGLYFANGALESLQAETSGRFKKGPVAIMAEDLMAAWSKSTDAFSLSGTASLEVGEQTVRVDVHDLSIVSGALNTLDVGVTAAFDMHGVTITPNALTVGWSTDTLKLYGGIEVAFAGTQVAATLGDEQTPGMRIVNGQLDGIDIGISSDFHLHGLEIKTDALTLEWTRKDNEFQIHGMAKLVVDGDALEADFGQQGVIIKQGKLHAFDVAITSDIRLGNLEVKTKRLRVSFTSENPKYLVSGEVGLQISDTWVDVALGNNGLEIDVSDGKTRFKVEDLTLEVDHLDLGGIDLKKLKLAFDEYGLEEATLMVAFPGGSEVSGELAYVEEGGKKRLDQVKIDWMAEKLQDAVNLDGVGIVRMQGELYNLARQTKWIKLRPTDEHFHKTESPWFAGRIETIYGGGLSVDGHDGTFLEAALDYGELYDFGLYLPVTVNVGAYRDPSSSSETDAYEWKSVLGSGHVNLAVEYGHYVELDAKLSFEANVVKADALVYGNEHGDFDALVDVRVCFPKKHFWPLNGKCVYDIGGAIRYKSTKPDHSYAAGWLSVHTFWHTYHPGIEYNFSTRKTHFSLHLDSGAIKKQIKKDIAGAGKGGPSVTQQIHSFEVGDESVHSLLIRMNWHDVLESPSIAVIGPDGFHELVALSADLSPAGVDSLSADSIRFDTIPNQFIFPADSVANFLVVSATTIDTTQSANESLLPGQYDVYLSFEGDREYLVDMSVHPFVDEGAISLSGSDMGHSNGVQFRLEYTSFRPDSTVLTLYRADTLAYHRGVPVEHYSGTFQSGRTGALDLPFRPKTLTSVDSLWFFAVLDDGANPPVRSAFAGPFVFEPDIYGSIVGAAAVTDTLSGAAFASPAGSLVFLDLDGDGSWDTGSEPGQTEPHDQVSPTGTFALNGLDEVDPGTYSLRFVWPDYLLQMTWDPVETVQWTGNPMMLTIDPRGEIQ